MIGRKKNYLDIASVEQAKSHTRSLGHGSKRKPLGEKLNLF